MIFRKVSSINPVAEYLAGVISNQLKDGKRVLWLITGGSGIGIAVNASTILTKTGTPLQGLEVTLTDERYGEVGHRLSNWQQLMDAGFKVPSAKLVPVLVGKDLKTTTRLFNECLEKIFKAVDYRLGFIGIGPDGHTAGILPNSPALESADLAAAYSDSQVPENSPAGVTRGVSRITMTVPAIAMLDEVVVYAIGETKWPVLDTLETDVSLNEQPAQALKRVPKLTIFNDHKGDLI